MADGTAVLVIDVQNAVLRGRGGARQAEADRALDALAGRIAKLIAEARRAGAPVVWVQHDGGVGHRLEPGTEGWEIREEIRPAGGDPVVRKCACDSFFETPLGETLRSLGARRLVVVGCMSQYCVDTTVRRAVTSGYDVVLAADGHSTVDEGELRFEQIIAHHNVLLDGFVAGAHTVEVRPLAEIQL